MGEAFLAVSDDASALAWNPAGLTQIRDREVYFMHNALMLDVSEEFIAYCQKIDKYWIGFSAAFLNSGLMERTLENGSGDYDGTDNSFSFADSAYSFSFAQKLGRATSFGITLRILSTAVDDAAGGAVGIDAGVMYKIPGLNNFKVAAALQNLGPGISYSESVQDMQPFCLRIGTSYEVKTDIGPASLCADLNFPIDGSVSFNAGLEYWIEELFALRIGYKTDRIADLGVSGFCCGLGFCFQNFQFDYAFIPYGNLGQSHRISILARF